MNCRQTNYASYNTSNPAKREKTSASVFQGQQRPVFPSCLFATPQPNDIGQQQQIYSSPCSSNTEIKSYYRRRQQ